MYPAKRCIIFERKVVQKLRQAGIQCRRIGGRYDNGVDIIANLLGVQFIIQSKNWTIPIGPNIIREMAGASLLFSKETIPIVVAPLKNRFSPGSVKMAKKLNIILTDEKRICEDIINLVDKRLRTRFNLKIKYMFFSFIIIIFLFVISNFGLFGLVIEAFNGGFMN